MDDCPVSNDDFSLAVPCKPARQPCSIAVPVRILVVEDDALVALGIQTILEDSGYHVCGIAASEPEAIALAGATAPTLALMDICLRGPTDGIETAKRLRSLYGLSVLYLSAFTDQRTKDRILETEPLGFMQKPCSASQLKAGVEHAVRQLVLQADRRP